MTHMEANEACGWVLLFVVVVFHFAGFMGWLK